MNTPAPALFWMVSYSIVHPVPPSWFTTPSSRLVPAAPKFWMVRWLMVMVAARWGVGGAVLAVGRSARVAEAALVLGGEVDQVLAPVGPASPPGLVATATWELAESLTVRRGWLPPVRGRPPATCCCPRPAPATVA